MDHKRLIKRIVLAVVALVLVVALTFGIVSFIRYQSLEETGLPRIEIYTEHNAPINSKIDYTACTVTLNRTDAAYCFENVAAEIRGRGNDTWNYYPKKPYRIRFAEKTSMLGETENRSWVLLALYNDFSYSKDRLAYAMAARLDADFAPSYHYVDLYVNGDYRGVYLLTDQIDENEGRTNVEATFDATMVEVPFLVELDHRAPEEGIENVDWFAVSDRYYALKYPKVTERYTQEQFDYIKQYIATVDALCRKQGITMAELSEYVDMQSFMDFYIVQEVMGQNEINWKSVYMSRSIDGKLKMGPVWDFDWAATGPSLGDDSETWRKQYEGLRSNGNWFDLLYRNSPEFREALADRWDAVRDELMDEIEILKQEKPMLDRAIERDHLRWHWYRFHHSYDDYFNELIVWLDRRIQWLDSAFTLPN